MHYSGNNIEDALDSDGRMNMSSREALRTMEEVYKTLITLASWQR